MIRRELAAQPAGEGHWILISQIDHARLSGRLAENWGSDAVAPLVARDELLWAIAHHDDGWRGWDEAPDVEPKSGRPRSFTEMRLDEGLEIWTGSISSATQHSALAGYVVAGHFCALLRRFDSAWKNEAQAREQAERFLATYDCLREGCLRAWLAASPEHTELLAERALAQLQLFDALSLWLCCHERPEPEEFATLGGAAVRLAMADKVAQGEPRRVVARPWPLVVEAMNLEIPGRQVPMRSYQGGADLAAAPSQHVQLRWLLTPSGQES